MTTETAEWTGPARYLPPTEPQEQPDGSLHYEGVTYAVVIGYRPLQLDLWLPAGAARPPVVVWIHGGAFLFGDRRYLPETLRPNQLFEALTDAGLAVATIDYRLALEATFPAQLHDIKAAVRYLRAHADELGIDTTRIGVMGESAGGHLTAMLALTGNRPDLEGSVGVVGPSSAVDVAVDWYGLSDIAIQPAPTFPPELAARLDPVMLTAPEDHLVGRTDPAARAAASPITYVTAAAPPMLLIHGTADHVVPFRHSELLATALTEVGVANELVPVEGADHIFLGSSEVDAIVGRSVDYLAAALLPN